MEQEILDRNQKLFLKLISQEPKIIENFYLTGGTALSAFYLNHRYSEDLDFFSPKEVNPQLILAFLKKIKPFLKFNKIDFQPSFNRNIFFIYFGKKILKIEFTYFPFSRVDQTKKRGEIDVDSPKDIAVNKLFTIYQKPRSRDFIDLYFIIKKYHFSFSNLMKLARLKFDWHIDLLVLGSRLIKVKEIKDYPKMIKEIKHLEWQNYFLHQAKQIGKKIFKK